jgi:hypothetical protein
MNLRRLSGNAFHDRENLRAAFRLPYCASEESLLGLACMKDESPGPENNAVGGAPQAVVPKGAVTRDS